jgi:hypothetical protein
MNKAASTGLWGSGKVTSRSTWIAPCKSIRWGFIRRIIILKHLFSKPVGNQSYPEGWSATGSEFCIVSSNAGMKRKQ